MRPVKGNISTQTIISTLSKLEYSRRQDLTISQIANYLIVDEAEVRRLIIELEAARIVRRKTKDIVVPWYGTVS